MFLNKERAIPEGVSTEQVEITFPSSIRKIMVSERAEQLPFLVLDETFELLTKFNATGPSMLIKFNPPGEEQEHRHILKNALLQ